MATLRDGPEAGEAVRRHEQGSPHLVLPHVHALVRACRFQDLGIPSDDDMPNVIAEAPPANGVSR